MNSEPARKLTTILAADVAGYSRLASADEDRTLARLRAIAHAYMAWGLETRVFRAGFNEADVIAGVRHARLALAHGGDDATALSIAAVVVLHLGHDFAAASGAITRALSLNNCCATALYSGAHIHAFSGDPAIAEDYANRALRLSPFDPQAFNTYESLGFVRFRARRYDEAASFFTQAVQANPRFSTLYADLTVALALAGRMDEAKAGARRLLELEPGFRSGPVMAMVTGFARPELVAGYAAGLRKAGLPE
jgi:adenylate cyclase